MKTAHFYIFLINLVLFAKSSLGMTIIDRADIPEVFQREYIFTSASKHTYVQTYGVATCVAMVMANGEGQMIMAHLDSGTNLEKAILEFVKVLGEASSVRLFGGQPPYRLESRIVTELLKFKLYPDLIIRNEKNGSLNVILNLQTGDVEEYDETYAATDYRIANEKVKRLKFSSRISRHEDSIGGGDSVIIDQEDSRPFFNISF